VIYLVEHIRKKKKGAEEHEMGGGEGKDVK